MLTLKLYKQLILFLHFDFLILNAIHGNTQEIKAVISIQLQSTSSYSIAVSIRNDKYNKFQEHLFSNKNSTITFKYLDDGSGSYVTNITASDNQNQKENLYYTCFVNETIMALHCRRNISCTIQNCTSCITSTGIRWIYYGYISSNYITNKTEHCDDGQEIVMYAINQNGFSISTSTTSSQLKTASVTGTSTPPPHFTTMNVRETSANLTLPESSSKDKAGVIAGVTVSVIILVTVAVLIVFMWRKRKSQKDSSCGNDSQNVSRQNNNYVRSPEDVRDVKKETYNKPMSSTTYLEQSSNNLNNDPITITIKSEPETSIYTGIDDDVSTAQLNVFNSDYEKSNSLDNYTTARRSNEQPEISTCTFSNENDYNVIDYSQGDTNFRDSRLETIHFDDGYSSVDMPREITSGNNADFSPEIQSTVETAVDKCSQVDQHSYNGNHKNVSNYMNLPKDLENTKENKRNVYSKLRENISKFKDTYGDLETFAQEENDPSQPSETDTYFTLETEHVSTDTNKIELVD
ncbi:uncharacterized protein LOC106058295 [Biomphalaria glabrata]|uniref:Uncharacterized protein LOC106058295 n=1 Tax=Biomphalaria glabrata TaxID=6526 RepID=A0A9W2YCB7_BIOGL|nr:uncharacterized protein LOC106058295 [Biomphalaria glabrata]XP_055860352.1 uncharacterized protein LOC106058295 [Biomphalaria glabrata]